MTWNVLGGGVALPSINAGADSSRDATLSQRGEQLVIPWFQQYVHSGRVYVAANATVNTAVALAGTSYVQTTPAFLLDVPAGTTAVPLHIRLRQGGTVAGGVITVLLTCDVVNRYSSGGTVITPRNMKIGPSAAAQRVAVCSFYTGPTAANLNTAIELAGTILTHDVATTPNSYQNVFEWSPLNGGEPAPELVGPASLLVHSFAATTAPSWFFSFKWIELDS